ncbi:MAG: DUF1648 domain-containing protein [Nanoarchaeota archaeon]
MKAALVFSICIIILSLIIGIALYPSLPDQMASHWNARGQVDGSMPRFWGVFLMPIISISMLILFLLIPKIDPLKKNVQKFRKYFDSFILMIIAFLFYIYALTLIWNLGTTFNMSVLIIPGIALLFFTAGVLVSHAERNWFIGIRTPWTLSNDVVWKKTHKVGGVLFKIAALLALVGIFFPRYALFFVIIPVLGMVVFTLVYSYVVYRQVEKKR